MSLHLWTPTEHNHNHRRKKNLNHKIQCLTYDTEFFLSDILPLTINKTHGLCPGYFFKPREHCRGQNCVSSLPTLTEVMPGKAEKYRK